MVDKMQRPYMDCEGNGTYLIHGTNTLADTHAITDTLSIAAIH